MENTNETPQSNENYQSPVNKPTVARKTLIITILIALVFMVGLWTWKSTETGNLRKDAALRQNNLKKEAGNMIIQTHEHHLKLLTKPFVWAVRSEMLQGNLSQVNLYMNEMIKEKNFQLIALTNDKGIIISSTNKKDVGKPFSTIGNHSDLVHGDTYLQIHQDSVINMTSPVMGFNNRLGTLFIKYSIPPAQFEH